MLPALVFFGLEKIYPNNIARDIIFSSDFQVGDELTLEFPFEISREELIKGLEFGFVPGR
ncbi:MAG: hypothetical protein NTZ97_03845 [Candidatus Moranbacteria bacterium]|nr:hypothetical protein [Candidatus Moranbacteria bacterium]